MFTSYGKEKGGYGAERELLRQLYVATVQVIATFLTFPVQPVGVPVPDFVLFSSIEDE